MSPDLLFGTGYRDIHVTLPFINMLRRSSCLFFYFCWYFIALLWSDPYHTEDTVEPHLGAFGVKWYIQHIHIEE
jgi:hypothetical protein